MSNATPCYHCGTAVPPAAPWSISLGGRTHSLCCPGCEAVAQAIIDGGLESYYRHRTELPERQNERQAAKADTWSAFDAPDLQKRFVHSDRDTGTVNTTLAVEGITCAACAWLIEHRLNALTGITSSAVNLTHYHLRVSWNPQQLKLSQLLAELAAIGYGAQPCVPDLDQMRRQREERLNVRRLIIATLAMIALIMLSMAMHTSPPGERSDSLYTLFRWLSLALATPVVLFSAQPVFRDALRDLRTGGLGMQVPMSLAIGGAYLASSYAVLTEVGDVYFETLAMLSCFMLLVRFLEQRARKQVTRKKSAHGRHYGNAPSSLLPGSAIRLESDGRERIVPASQLSAGQRILIKPGHGVPADGVIEDGESSLDESMLTGEYLPVSRGTGDTIMGGSRNMEHALTVRVTHAGRDTRIVSVADLTERVFARPSRLAQKAARWVHLWVFGLLMMATCITVAWWLIEPSRAWWVLLSIVVATCPCALALATPCALTAGYDQLRKRGVLLTHTNAMESLARATRVVFYQAGYPPVSEHADATAANTIKALQDKGLSVEMLFEGAAEGSENLAEQLNMTTSHAGTGGHKTRSRLHALKADARTVVIMGDGINKVSRFADADAALLSPRFMRVYEAIEIARATRRIFRQNMTGSICYLLVMLPLAAIALIPPWLAVMGLSLSTLLVVGNTLRLSRWRHITAPDNQGLWI